MLYVMNAQSNVHSINIEYYDLLINSAYVTS